MVKVKGTGVDALRRIVGARGPEFEKRYLDQLTPEERDVHLNALPVSWIPLNLEEKGNSLIILAQMLFPGDPLALQKIGSLMAKESLPRFYQIFIRIPSVNFVFKRAAAIWKSIYDRGEASIENLGDKSLHFVLHSFPDYPAFLREYMCGYIKGVGDLLHLKNVQVRKIENDPQAWKWEVTWE